MQVEALALVPRQPVGGGEGELDLDLMHVRSPWTSTG
jgi:hypothetical protein